MPATTVPNQFGDPTLTPAEAASACGPAAAVAFARANGRNPTLREATDLARKVGWTEAGGMNGVANQKALLDRMGVPAELDTSASVQSIAARARAGDLVTVSTPIHYYVVDDVDARGRVHVGQSGLARRGGAEWMTLEDIASRDGGINGALYAAHPNAGGQAMAEGDRPPSEFEPPSRFPPTTPAPTRSSRMQARIDELKAARAAKQAQLDALQKPGPDEIPASETERLDPRFEARATQARQNREVELRQRHQELVTLDTQLNSLQTDLANDADAKPDDPVAAEAKRVALEAAKLALAEAQKKAAKATSPEEARLTQLEITKAELGVKQAEATLANTLNPRPPYRSPEQIAKDALDVQKAQRDLLPKQQQILQAHADTVKYIQGMLERGEIDPSQADAYVQLSKQAAEAGLRGSTPFEEMDARRKADEAQKKMGIDLINQRVSTGGGLAQSLMSSAMGPNVMMRPGQTSLGVDPLSSLLPILEQLQGPGTNAMAQGLLTGAGAGGQAPPPPGGAMPAGL